MSIPAGKTLFERKNSQKAARRRKEHTLYALKLEASRPPSPPPPPTPPEVRPVGNDVPPAIPEEVLALPLWPLWTDLLVLLRQRVVTTRSVWNAFRSRTLDEEVVIRR
jgi:hypothetical protein